MSVFINIDAGSKEKSWVDVNKKSVRIQRESEAKLYL